MISPRFKPSKGGVEKHVEMLSKNLVEQKIKVTVVTCAHILGLNEHEKWRGIDIVRMPYSFASNPYRAYRWWRANRHLAYKHEIVHIHDPHQLLFWYLPLLLYFPKKKPFITFHGFERDPILRYWIVLRKISELLTQRNICIGDFIEYFYGTSCDKISIGAVDIQKRSEKMGNKLVFVGRLERDTGILEHVDALNILKTEFGFDPELIICGQGTLYNEIESKAHEHDLRVRMVGMVSNPIDFMRDASICLAAGYLSILEAMSLGLPVIGISTSHLKYEYLKAVRTQGGPLSLQTTSIGVAREIARLLNDPSLQRRISKRSFDFAKKQSWNNMSRTYLELWNVS
jgi:glycosyltransferase involved in cell wall biosynthesis